MCFIMAWMDVFFLFVGFCCFYFFLSLFDRLVFRDARGAAYRQIRQLLQLFGLMTERTARWARRWVMAALQGRWNLASTIRAATGC